MYKIAQQVALAYLRKEGRKTKVLLHWEDLTPRWQKWLSRENVKNLKFFVEQRGKGVEHVLMDIFRDEDVLDAFMDEYDQYFPYI